MPGPVPKRASQRRRKHPEGVPRVVKSPLAPKPPPADPSWDPQAIALYESLTRSPQATFYEPSDWEFARVQMSILTAALKRPQAAMFEVVNRALARLLVTEADRRRARVEVERELAGEPPELALVERYRKDLA